MGSLIASLIAKKAAGHVLGLFASKTQWGATGIAGSALWTILPRVLEGDNEAIGQLVMLIGSYLLALYGRMRAGK